MTVVESVAKGMTAAQHLLGLLREYEHRLLPNDDHTPRGVAESLKGDWQHPQVLDDAEIIWGLAERLLRPLPLQHQQGHIFKLIVAP
jgi:hypothetical protein